MLEYIFKEEQKSAIDLPDLTPAPASAPLPALQSSSLLVKPEEREDGWVGACAGGGSLYT